MSSITHLWTRLTSARHEDAWVERLRFAGPEALVIKAFPASRTLRLQVYTSQATAKQLVKLFGGSVRPFNAATWTPPNTKRSVPLRIAGGLRLYNDRATFLADKNLSLQSAAAAKSFVTPVLAPSATGASTSAATLKAGSKKTVGSVKGYPLLIPASMAFGTGEHATTSSCLRLLNGIAATLPSQKWSLLDLGMGSGILALAGELLGAKKIIGVDNDERCVKISQENALANQLPLAQFYEADLLKWKIPGKWNVVVANIYSSVLSTVALKIVKAILPHGYLILSGILACEVQEIATLFETLGMKQERIITRGKWAALQFRKTSLL